MRARNVVAKPLASSFCFEGSCYLKCLFNTFQRAKNFYWLKRSVRIGDYIEDSSPFSFFAAAALYCKGLYKPELLTSVEGLNISKLCLASVSCHDHRLPTQSLTYTRGTQERCSGYLGNAFKENPNPLFSHWMSDSATAWWLCCTYALSMNLALCKVYTGLLLSYCRRRI